MKEKKEKQLEKIRREGMKQAQERLANKEQLEKLLYHGQLPTIEEKSTKNEEALKRKLEKVILDSKMTFFENTIDYYNRVLTQAEKEEKEIPEELLEQIRKECMHCLKFTEESQKALKEKSNKEQHHMPCPYSQCPSDGCSHSL